MPVGFWLDDTVSKTVRYAKEFPWLYAAAVWIPVLLFVLLFKLLKYELLASVSLTANADQTLLGVFQAHGVLPILLFVASFSIGLLIQIRIASRGYYLLPATIVAFVGLSIAVRSALPVHPPAWISMDFLVVIRQDLAAVGIVIAVTTIAIASTRGLLLRLILFCVHVAALLIAWLSLFDFGYFFQTGSMADSFMLRYSLTHLTEVRHVVGSQMDLTSWVLVLSPLLLSFIPLFLGNVRRRRVHVHSYSWRMKRGLVLTSLLVVGFFFTRSATVTASAAILRPSIPVDLLTDFIRKNDAVDPIQVSADVLAWPDGSFAPGVTDSTWKPNIVMIVAESVRASFSGKVASRTVMPFVDSLKAHSLTVDDMSVVVPHTNKALVSLLCGVYPELKQTASRSVTTSCLPRVLASLGYATSFFTPADLEFEKKGEMLETMGFAKVRGDGEYKTKGFTRVNYFGFEDDVMLEPSLKWMNDQRESERPFFMTLLTLTAHHDYRVPAGWTSTAYTGGASFNRYLNTVAYQDRFIRNVVKSLESSGLMEQTIVVIVSDHGEAFAEHGLNFHSAVPYQEVVRVPALIYSPNFVKPGVISGVRQQTDLVPTLYSLLNLDYDQDALPGRSLFTPADSVREIYSSGWIEYQSMVFRRGNRKHIYHFRRKPIEVFDLTNDPDEREDLASSLSENDKRDIERRLLTWRQAVNRNYTIMDSSSK